MSPVHPPARLRVFSSSVETDIDRFRRARCSQALRLQLLTQARMTGGCLSSALHAAWIQKKYVAEGPAQGIRPADLNAGGDR